MATSKKGGNAAQRVTTVAQASAVKLNKATDGLLKVISELQTTNDSYDELVLNIELKQAELDSLETKKAESIREMEADLKIRQKESEEALVVSILASGGYTSIKKEELSALEKELSTLKSSFNESVKAETAKAVAIVTNTHQSAIKQQELEHKANTATMEAQLATAKDSLSTLNAQIEDYKEQIKSDREARVQEAQARGGQSITVQSESKR